MLENKIKKQVDDKNEWLRWSEKINLWMEFKERKWGHCEKNKRVQNEWDKLKWKGAN